MARNKKPRKRHIAKPHQLPVTIRFNADDERTLQLVPHQELALLMAGDGTEQSWHTITCRLNIGMTLARIRDTGEEIVTMAQALDAVCDVSDRFKRIGKWGASGEEAKLIGAGLVLTDDMQLDSTRREMRDAMKYVFKEGAINANAAA
jgi:hypothetical protein